RLDRARLDFVEVRSEKADRSPAAFLRGPGAAEIRDRFFVREELGIAAGGRTVGIVVAERRRSLGGVDHARDEEALETEARQRPEHVDQLEVRADHPERDALLVEVLVERQAEEAIERVDAVEEALAVGLAPGEVLPADAEE